jgi:hypothetical protein
MEMKRTGVCTARGVLLFSTLYHIIHEMLNSWSGPPDEMDAISVRSIWKMDALHDSWDAEWKVGKTWSG